MPPPFRQDISAFRKDPLQKLMTLFGVDLTDNTSLSFAVKLATDVPGDPLLLITSGTGATGIKLIDVGTDGEGLPYSTVQISDTKAHMGALPSAAEYGATVRLSWDLQWVPPTSITAPATAVEQTLAYGNLIILGSVND